RFHACNPRVVYLLLSTRPLGPRRRCLLAGNTSVCCLPSVLRLLCTLYGKHVPALFSAALLLCANTPLAVSSALRRTRYVNEATGPVSDGPTGNGALVCQRA